MKLPLMVQNYCFEITYVILDDAIRLQLSITYTSIILHLWLSATKMSISPILPSCPLRTQINLAIENTPSPLKPNIYVLALSV